MTEIKENKNLGEMLLASYPVPYVGDDYHVSLYLYNEANHEELIFSEKYYDEIPKKMVASRACLRQDRWCLSMDEEFVICINEDVCSVEERVGVLAECLFRLATIVSERAESEEFASRVLGDAFRTMAPLLDPALAAAGPSPLRGVDVSVYPFPLVSDDCRVTLSMYDESDKDGVEMKLCEVYGDKMITGDLDLQCVHGFVARPSADEIAVFIQCEDADSLLMQQQILAHELFHAVTRLIADFDDSAVLGARIYQSIFVQFAGVIAQLKGKE